MSSIIIGQNSNSLLNLLETKSCGIDYQNNITESGLYNHVFWENIYHGAGVAIGDVNNDGLADIFFSGNQVRDELYLNQGDFQFQNITKNLDAPAKHYWSNGVTMADINADGWLDIYVCKSGPSLEPADRGNLLFINNQDNTFTEQAEKLGLADQGYGMQAVFFDMDNDGDLDAYVMNQPPSTVQEKRQNVLENTSCDEFSDNLYRNDNGNFVNITKEAGVHNCAYGLGVVATDINNDGWTDLYISNDYVVSDFLYINQKNGTFKEEANSSFSHESLYAMGVDIADINNDHLLDVFTADMSAADHYRNKTNMPSMNRERFGDIVKAGYNHQFMFNALQINNGDNVFSEVAQMSGVANTDWSWSAMMVDIDNNQDKDILITNGIKRDVRFVDGLNKLRKTLADGTINLSEIIAITPSQPLKNFAYRNKGDLTFDNTSDEWGFAVKGFSNGMALGDLDNDGDLDVVVNNVDSAPFLFKNSCQNNYLRIKLEGAQNNPFAYGAKVEIESEGNTQLVELSPTRGYLSSSEPIIHFGLGNANIVNKVTITWGGGKETILTDQDANQLIKVAIKEAKNKSTEAISTQKDILFSPLAGDNLPQYKHQEISFDPFQNEVLLPHKFSQLGPALAVGDIDGDGLEDIFIGGAKDQSSQLLFQKSTGEFVSAESYTWQIDSKFEDVEALFFDANNDGHTDIYVASGSNELKKGAAELQDRLYINHDGIFVHDTEALPKMLITTGTVKASDFDNDGDLDLLVGGLMDQQKYPAPAASFLLENQGGKFIDVTKEKAIDLQQIGMVRDAVWSDIDADGDDDIMIVGEWMKITCLLNQNGNFESANIPDLEKSRGWWHSIEASDFDNDGDIDFFIGNLGLNNKFKKDDKNGFHLFANDFDGNGSLDIVLSKEKEGKLLPVRGRECSSEQMPFIAEKFPTFHDFAIASLEDIYTPEKLQNANHYEIDLMESIYLENKGNQTFTIHSLPTTAQVSVITDFVIKDFDEDGYLDVITVGNKYETEVETARYDAGVGLFLKGNQKGYFDAIPAKKSGLLIRGNMRSADVIQIGDKNILLTAINDGELNFQLINTKQKSKKQ